jgi:hypothetical protein
MLGPRAPGVKRIEQLTRVLPQARSLLKPIRAIFFSGRLRSDGGRFQFPVDQVI